MEQYNGTPKTNKEKDQAMNHFIDRRQELVAEHEVHVGNYENTANDNMDDVFRDSDQIFKELHSHPSDTTQLKQDQLVIKKVEAEITKHAA